jgi:hypothetical protein
MIKTKNISQLGEMMKKGGTGLSLATIGPQTSSVVKSISRAEMFQSKMKSQQSKV